jgi:PAS domain S-box-containing protein
MVGAFDPTIIVDRFVGSQQSISGKAIFIPMLTTEIAVLLVADAHADQWMQLIRQADSSVRISCVPEIRAVPEKAASIDVGVLCLDGVVAARNSLSFIEETIARARLAANTPIIVLTGDAQIADRYRSHSAVSRVLLCRTAAEHAVCVAEFQTILIQARMQSQLQLFTAAVEGSSNGLVVVDMQRHDQPIVYANAAFTKLTGYRNDEVLGKNCRFLQGANTERATVDQLRKALDEVTEYTGEILNYRKDGTPFWNRIHVRPLRGSDGKAQYFVATSEDVSESKRIRERLRASEARLELAMAASELAMWDWNVATGEIYYNDQWQGLLELPAEELLLRESLAGRLALPEDDPSLLLDLEKHLHGETARFEREFDVRTSSGKAKSVLARANVVRRTAEGQALRVIGVWRDMSARKATLRTIEETHKRWERAVAGTSDGLFDWDLVTGYVWYAPRFREQLGYTEAEFNETFTAFQRVVHVEERVGVLTKIRNHLEQRAPLDIRCRVQCKSGEYRWFRLRGNAERDAAGRPRRLSGSIRDITGQIDAEQALHRSEDFYSTVLDALPITVAFIDQNEHVLYANKATSALLGTGIEHVRDRPMREVLSAELYADLAPSLTVACRGEVVERQLHTLDSDGQPIDIDVTFLPHKDATAKIQGCFLMARNVTTRVRLEAELRQSQKMEAIGKLTGGVAHDFNNLLSVTIGNAQLLSRTLKDSPRLHKQAETILRAAMRGAELTRRLLTFARQQQSTMQVIKVDDVISGMYDLLRRTLPNDIELSLELDDAASSAKLDAGQFENALLNLVINARDAMPHGGNIRIRTSTVLIDGAHSAAYDNLPPGEYVRVTVADTGAGMTPEVLARVFEPFFTTKEFGKGSGLGMAMVHGFVKHSMGGIRVTSTVGEGTEVHLYFPRAQELKSAGELPLLPVAELPRGTEAILVVDGNVDVRTTAVEILASLGYRVFEASNGREAIDLANREAVIDLVFADVMLAGGVSTMSLIRKLRERHAHIRVLLTSGFSDSVITHRSMLDGSIDVLHKPYELSDLARRVRAALDSIEEKIRVPA